MGALRSLTAPELRAIVDVVLAVAYEDGVLSTSEQHSFREMVVRLTGTEEDVAPLLALGTLDLERDGPEALVRSAAAQLGDPDARAIVASMAARVLDDDSSEAERRRLRRVCEALDVELPRA
ncbi:MAG: TerB family tellurite resistance protein [Sandaracinaceae bacterium]